MCKEPTLLSKQLSVSPQLGGWDYPLPSPTASFYQMLAFCCQGGHVMLRSVHLFVSLFINRITQSLVKDLNENIYQRVWAWASLKVINNWSQVKTWMWEFLYRCDETRENWTFCKYTSNRNTVRPRCEVLRKTSLDPWMQSWLLDISSWM